MAGAWGPHIVADPAICHGEPTFRGTRILVTDVLDQVASGMAWEAIIDEWRGALTNRSIAEALRWERVSDRRRACDRRAER
jgi:uncharacterized protein (DUF433 family)